MRPFMILTLYLSLLAPTFSIAQQKKPCDASPRWLLVTVVQSAMWIKNISKGDKPQYSDNERLELVDRCEGDVFSIQHHSGPEKGVAAEIRQVTIRDGETIAWVRFWVKESLRDICRAMRDCGDSTSGP